MFTVAGTTKSLEVSVNDLQADNYSETVLYPVVLHSGYKRRGRREELAAQASSQGTKNTKGERAQRCVPLYSTYLYRFSVSAFASYTVSVIIELRIQCRSCCDYIVYFLWNSLLNNSLPLHLISLSLNSLILHSLFLSLSLSSLPLLL